MHPALLLPAHGAGQLAYGIAGGWVARHSRVLHGTTAAEDAGASLLSGLTKAARTLQGAGPVNKAQVERLEALLKAGVTPDWQASAQAGRRLQGAGPVNKAQVERLEALLKTGVTPDWQEGNQAGRRLQGTKHANKAQVERLEAMLKTGVTPDWQEGIQAGRKM
ncbi:hypothetical protein OEZ86_007502 [Tetradesmus obliquus]|nr:hypothetical protein OEZ86_007502 [Tetradesmus obliquus]